MKYSNSYSVMNTCSSVFSDTTGLCTRRTVFVLSEVSVLSMNRIWQSDAHTSGMTRPRGEKHPGYSNPVPVNATTTKKIKAVKFLGNIKCWPKHWWIKKYLIVEHHTRPPLASLHSELQAGYSCISLWAWAFFFSPSDKKASTCNKASVGCPVSV